MLTHLIHLANTAAKMQTRKKKSIQKRRVVPVGFYLGQITGEYAYWQDEQGKQIQRRQMERQNIVKWIIAVFQESKAGCYSCLPPTSFYLGYKGKHRFVMSWSADRSEDLRIVQKDLLTTDFKPLRLGSHARKRRCIIRGKGLMVRGHGESTHSKMSKRDEQAKRVRVLLHATVCYNYPWLLMSEGPECTTNDSYDRGHDWIPTHLVKSSLFV